MVSRNDTCVTLKHKYPLRARRQIINMPTDLYRLCVINISPNREYWKNATSVKVQVKLSWLQDPGMDSVVSQITLQQSATFCTRSKKLLPFLVSFSGNDLQKMRYGMYLVDVVAFSPHPKKVGFTVTHHRCLGDGLKLVRISCR